jgi:surface antigen
MKFKSVLVALGVIASVASFNGTTVGATSNQTEEKTEVKQQTVVTVEAGDTLESIATKHNTTYVYLFNANPTIEHPDRINAGDKVTIPAEGEEFADRMSQLVAATAPVAATTPVASATAATYTTQQYSSAPVNATSYYVGNGMWCTDYVHSKRPDVAIYGNAGYNWIGAAQAEGKATGSAPQAGAVAVMDGHVAYVESVNSDGSYVVSEMGWNYQAGNYNQRTVQPGSFGGFIY